jgi:hypothetical protein
MRESLWRVRSKGTPCMSSSSRPCFCRTVVRRKIRPCRSGSKIGSTYVRCSYLYISGFGAGALVGTEGRPPVTAQESSKPRQAHRASGLRLADADTMMETWVHQRSGEGSSICISRRRTDRRSSSTFCETMSVYYRRELSNSQGRIQIAVSVSLCASSPGFLCEKPGPECLESGLSLRVCGQSQTPDVGMRERSDGKDAASAVAK